MTDWGSNLTDDGTTFVSIFNKPNNIWSYRAFRESNADDLYMWYGFGTYLDTSLNGVITPSLMFMTCPYYYPSWGTSPQPTDDLAIERSLPGNAAYDDPNTAQNGRAYHAWSFSCTMALCNWCNSSGGAVNADPDWEVDDANGRTLAKLEFKLVNGTPQLLLNGIAFVNQPTGTVRTVDGLVGVVVVPGLANAGDHASFGTHLTISGYDNGVVIASIVDATATSGAARPPPSAIPVTPRC